MYKLSSIFVDWFEAASKYRPSKGLCASVTVDLFSLYFVVLQATSQKYFICIYQNVDASSSRSETPGKFCNVVLEEDGKDQLD